MPALPNERQYRMMSNPLGVECRAGFERRFETDFYVEGYASTFNDPYVLWHDSWDDVDIREMVLPDAFTDCDMSDVIMQFDHTGRVFARMSNNTLVVEPDRHGLFVAADLGSTDNSRSLFADIDAGLITRMSWAFTIDDEEYDRAENTYIIKKVRKIYDVSAVSLPADPNTEISARRMLDGVIEQRHKEIVERARAIARARAHIAIANAQKG